MRYLEILRTAWRQAGKPTRSSYDFAWALLDRNNKHRQDIVETTLIYQIKKRNPQTDLEMQVLVDEIHANLDDIARMKIKAYENRSLPPFAFWKELKKEWARHREMKQWCEQEGCKY